jgi:hypothetical protein
VNIGNVNTKYEDRNVDLVMPVYSSFSSNSISPARLRFARISSLKKQGGVEGSEGGKMKGMNRRKKVNIQWIGKMSG